MVRSALRLPFAFTPGFANARPKKVVCRRAVWVQLPGSLSPQPPPPVNSILRSEFSRQVALRLAAPLFIAGLLISSGYGATAPVTAPKAAAVAGLKWIDAWGVSFLPTTVNGQLRPALSFDHQTIRLNIFSKLAGTQARVKFTNKFQTAPLVIGSAHLALRADAGTIVPATDRALTFSGAKSATLAAGAELWSDPVTLDVPQHAEVAVSIYLPENFKPTAFHLTGSKTNYVSTAGDFTSAPTMPVAPGTGRPNDSVYFISGLQVMAPARTKVIVAIGDSITDGAASSLDGNGSWPDMLSKRLPALPDGTPVSVINMGIGSNRITSADAAGPTGVHRFADDVLARSNVTHVLVLEGINDISYEHVKPEQLIAAYQDVIARAHAKGWKIFGGTLLPIQNSTKDTPENEATRQTVNQWIRTSKAYDAVLDFEKVVQDPANPLRIRRDLTGDFVHPNSTGYRLMAESIDLKLFE